MVKIISNIGTYIDEKIWYPVHGEAQKIYENHNNDFTILNFEVLDRIDSAINLIFDEGLYHDTSR